MGEWLGFILALIASPIAVLDDCRLKRRYKRVMAKQRQLELDLAEGE
jgi:hypothetical protein